MICFNTANQDLLQWLHNDCSFSTLKLAIKRSRNYKSVNNNGIAISPKFSCYSISNFTKSNIDFKVEHHQVSQLVTFNLSIQPNTNPFYMKFIVGNMRVYQGCRGCRWKCPSLTIGYVCSYNTVTFISGFKWYLDI